MELYNFTKIAIHLFKKQQSALVYSIHYLTIDRRRNILIKHYFKFHISSIYSLLQLICNFGLCYGLSGYLQSWFFHLDVAKISTCRLKISMTFYGKSDKYFELFSIAFLIRDRHLTISSLLVIIKTKYKSHWKKKSLMYSNFQSKFVNERWS